MSPTPKHRHSGTARDSRQTAPPATEQPPVEKRLEALAREAPGSDLAVQRLTVVLHRASRALSHVYRQALTESGLSLPDYQVLRALVYSGPPYVLHPGELARECGQTQSTMTHRLDLLEDRALVHRTPDPSHRARVLIELTPAGQDSWRNAQRYVAQAEEQALSTLTDREKEQLTKLLTAVLGPTQP